MSRIRWTTELAREAIYEKWGDKLLLPTNYSHKSIDTPIDFVCKEHGLFKRTLYKALKCKHPCPQCSPTGLKDWTLIEKELQKIHNNRYDYSIIAKEGYDCTKPIKILCNKHGSFNQLLGVHKKGSNCPKCVEEDTRITINDFLFESIQKHGNSYDYSLVYNNYETSNSKVPIICEKHGEFWQIAGDHKRGSGCPSCNNSSKGEIIIRTFLLRNSIEFETQKTFPDFHSDRGYRHKYKYDFYVPNKKLLIEYDGIHHLKDHRFNNYDLASQQAVDELKTKYAEKHGYTLLRISSLDKITNTLVDFLRLDKQ
jgi:very-short-patch-repair endonuclease